jgi:hypothetical protein
VREKINRQPMKGFCNGFKKGCNRWELLNSITTVAAALGGMVFLGRARFKRAEALRIY